MIDPLYPPTVDSIKPLTYFVKGFFLLLNFVLKLIKVDVSKVAF